MPQHMPRRCLDYKRVSHIGSAMIASISIICNISVTSLCVIVPRSHRPRRVLSELTDELLVFFQTAHLVTADAPLGEASAMICYRSLLRGLCHYLLPMHDRL